MGPGPEEQVDAKLMLLAANIMVRTNTRSAIFMNYFLLNFLSW